MPTTILFCPSPIIFPFVTETFVNLSIGRIAPEIIANGTVTSSSLPPTFSFIVAVFL